MIAAWKTVALGDVARIERSTIHLGLEHIGSGGQILGAKPVDEGELASSAQ